jgi:hypothetical protein
MDSTPKIPGTSCSVPPSMCNFFRHHSFSRLIALIPLSLFSGSTLLVVFGGHLDEIYTFLTEERFPEGWESHIRSQMGMTLFAFNLTVFKVELGIDEEVQQPLNLM